MEYKALIKTKINQIFILQIFNKYLNFQCYIFYEKKKTKYLIIF